MMQENQPASSIEVQVAPPFQSLVDPSQLVAAATAALREATLSKPSALSLVITDDAAIQELNRTYRGIDAPTDVLSFEMGEDPYRPEQEPLYLGDVIISYPRCAQQAREYGHSVHQELSLLAIHGVLHLLGYDHATDQEKQEMWRLQKRALDRVMGQEIENQSLPSQGQEG